MMMPGVRDMPGDHHQGGGGVEFESGAIFLIQDVLQDGRQLIVIFKK